VFIARRIGKTARQKGVSRCQRHLPLFCCSAVVFLPDHLLPWPSQGLAIKTHEKSERNIASRN
jgi:hypothetical protein